MKSVAPDKATQSFECRYAMKVDGRGMKSSVNGTDIVDAIKKSNPNAILVYVQDTDGTEYFIKEHTKPSAEGYFDFYWADVSGNIIYDERNAPPPIPVVVTPIPITNPEITDGWISPDGTFYECGFEEHYYKAKRIMQAGLVPVPEDHDFDGYSASQNYLEEELNWIKLSDGVIRNRSRINKRMTAAQKQTIMDYFMGKEFPYVKIWNSEITLERFMSDNF